MMKKFKSLLVLFTMVFLASCFLATASIALADDCTLELWEGRDYNDEYDTLNKKEYPTYAHTYQGWDYKGEAVNNDAYIFLYGPTHYSDLTHLYNHAVLEDGHVVKWDKEPQSIRIGDGAWVIAYTEPNFEGDAFYLAPGFKTGDLEYFDMGKKISSVKIFKTCPDCSKQWLHWVDTIK